MTVLLPFEKKSINVGIFPLFYWWDAIVEGESKGRRTVVVVRPSPKL